METHLLRTIREQTELLPLDREEIPLLWLRVQILMQFFRAIRLNDRFGAVHPKGRVAMNTGVTASVAVITQQDSVD